MTSTREGVNPLRPYYIPPTIGIGEKNESTPPQPNPFSHANATTTTASSSSNSNAYATKARGIFQDIDYKDYINDSSPSTVQSVKSLVDELLWKYTSVLMAQPFEVAKTILQVRLQDDLGGLHVAPPFTPAPNHRSKPSITSPKNPWSHSDNEIHSEEEEEEKELMDSEDEEQNYFTSNVPYTTPTPGPRSSHNNRRHPSSPPLTGSPKIPGGGGRPAPPGSVASGSAAAAATPAHPYQLGLRRPDSVFDVISQLWAKESAWGVWKGTNATFLYTVLQSLVENWSRSLLSALLNVPDLGVKDDVDRLVDIASPYPWASLCVAAAAAVASGLVLAPLDLVRTRLIITSTSPPARAGGSSRRQRQRRTVATLRALPSWTCPASLVVPTVLNALVHPLVTLSAPLVLRSQFLIDRDLSPTTFSVAKFCTSCAALFVKLPLETVLRRGQVAVLRDPAYVHAIEGGGGSGAGAGGAANLLHRRSRSSGLSPTSLSLSLEGIGDERQAFGGGRGLHADDDDDDEDADLELETIVQPGAYNGVFGTMYSISTEEGSRALVTPQSKQAKAKAGAAGKRGAAKAAKLSVPETVYKKGQGLEGLWRGWKVSWWGLVGLWVANVAGGGGEGEF